MRYLIILLFFIALKSQGQGQTKLVTIIDEFDIGRLSFKTINQKIDTTILVDGSVLYLLEFPGANADKTKGRFIIQWVPMVPPPTPVEPVLIDNVPGMTVNNQLVNTYVPGSPTWTHAVVTGHWSNTISFSNVANSSLTTKFTGTKIDGYFEKRDTHGKAMISIDGGPEKEINLNSTTQLKQQKVFESAVLARGLHTVKIRVVGGGFVVFDYWKVTP